MKRFEEDMACTVCGWDDDEEGNEKLKSFEFLIALFVFLAVADAACNVLCKPFHILDHYTRGSL